MSNVNINGVEYEVLGSINTGKREYVFVLDGDEVIYYKRDGEKFVKPSSDLTIEGYAGKSLTELTENVIITRMLELMKQEYVLKD